jgi:beta-ribofuranosylaminobenzene 5'-phosphate synthase
MIRVSTPSRLHFGLFALPASDGTVTAWPDRDGQPLLPARAFGGVGLMIEQPGLTVTVAPASAWTSEGALADRALAYARTVDAALQLAHPLHITVTTAMREHVGLGTGTQLGLAVARAVTCAAGRGDLEPMALAQLVGRGERSALGIHGFAHGGFLVEGGKRQAGHIAPLVARAAFPDAWRILVVIPQDLRGDHGPRERAAFRDLGTTRRDLHGTEALCRLVLLGMLPAITELELNTFGEALYDFNRRVGEMFRPWQGDLYAHPRIAAIIAALRSEGRVRGVGQSSWGPAVFAVIHADQADELCGWLARKHGCRKDELMVTGAANTGSLVSSISTTPLI